MSNVAHQYSRVDFYLSVEVNLSLYYGGVLSIIGFVTEVKQVLVGHRTQNCHLSDVVIFNVYISYKTVDAVDLIKIYWNIRFGS